MEAKLGFFIHVAVYLVVNGLLLTINLINSPQEYWFQWPLLGWGIGVLFHGLGVYVFAGGINVKEHMIEKEMKKQAKE